MRVDLAWVLRIFIFSICLTVWVPFAITIGGLNVRASQLVLPIVAILLLTRRPASTVSVWSLLAVAGAVVWWLSLLAWTLVNGPEFGEPMARVALMALNLLQALAVYVLVVRVGDVRVAFGALLVSVTALNGLLLLVSLAPALGIAIPRFWLAPEVAPILADGRIVEGTVWRFVGGGVLAGCISAATVVLAAGLWFDPVWRARWLLVAGGAAAIVGMVLGFSRQSVLSLVLGLLVVVPFAAVSGRRRLLRGAAAALVAGVIGVTIILATPQGRQYWSAFAGRTAQLADPGAYTTGTVADRAEIWSGMAAEIGRNPLVGHGQDAYLRFMAVDEEGAHNFPIEALHATGVVGFLGFLLLHAVGPVAAAVVIAEGRASRRVSVGVVNALAVYVAVVSASLTNLVYWNPTYWAVVGTTIASIRLATGRSGSGS